MERFRPQSAAEEYLANFDTFFAALGAAIQRLLVLDYDGTLAPFHIDPARAVPYDGVCELLDGIMRDPASVVVIVTGRPARELRALLPLPRSPAIWGSHGWEHLSPDGDYRCGPLDSRPIREALEDEAWVVKTWALGARIERKPSGLAIHWRGLTPQRVAEVRSVILERWRAKRLGRTLQWINFDGGVEWRLPGRDKRFVVETLLTAYPRSVAAYLGDDSVDEDAFRAIRERGLGVLVRPERRPSFARAWLQPPEQLLEFLARWEAIGRRGRQ